MHSFLIFFHIRITYIISLFSFLQAGQYTITRMKLIFVSLVGLLLLGVTYGESDFFTLVIDTTFFMKLINWILLYRGWARIRSQGNLALYLFW